MSKSKSSLIIFLPGGFAKRRAQIILYVYMAIQREQQTPALLHTARKQNTLYSIRDYSSEKRRQRMTQDRGPDNYAKADTH